MAENKVRYGLTNVHVAVIEETVDGKEVYGDFKRMRGAVNLSLDPVGEQSPFYADNQAFYVFSSNSGYTGSLEIAEIPEFFSQEILGEATVNGVAVESVKTKSKSFALAFEFDGDQKATRHVLYNCKANRPNIVGATTTEAIEAQTSELTFTASPNEAGNVRAKTLSTADETVYNAWYDAPFDAEQEAEELSTFTNKVKVEK